MTGRWDHGMRPTTAPPGGAARDPDEVGHPVTTHQADRLRAMLAAILPGNRFYARKFAATGVDVSAVLSHLPFTTKAELVADQQEHPPYGTVLTEPLQRYNRLHQSSGTTTGRPLRWLDTPESWQWVL